MRSVYGVAVCACLALAGCSRSDTAHAKTELHKAGNEMKHDLHQAGQEIKKDLHEANHEIRKGVNNIKSDNKLKERRDEK